MQTIKFGLALSFHLWSGPFWALRDYSLGLGQVQNLSGIGGKQKDQLLALVSPQIENFILFWLISYHIHIKMLKKYEFQTKYEKSYKPDSSAYMD